jgi:glycosyltransferase involved in cell wall biosynthesis
MFAGSTSIKTLGMMENKNPDRMMIPDGNKDIRLFEFLRYNSYLSNRYKFFYVATPKVACTTLKWWFAELTGYAAEIRNSKESLESEPDLIIHDTFHKIAPEVTGLGPAALAGILASDDYFRFAVVSNPFKRLFSAWQSKLLLQEPLQIGPYLHCDFLHHPIERKSDIAAAFEGFLEHLANKEAPDFLDYHWTPQAYLLRPDRINYSILVKIENPQELSNALNAWLGDTVPDPFKGPRLNESMIPYHPEFLTERSVELIRSLYAVDFESFGYGTEPPASHQALTEVQFQLVRKAIQLIRGRHKQLEERRKIVVQLQQLVEVKNEELRVGSEELGVLSEELRVKGEEWGRLREEVRVKGEEWGRLREEVRVLMEEGRMLREEGRGKREELATAERELALRNEIIEQKNEEISHKNAEISRLKTDLDKISTALHLTSSILESTKIEIEQKNTELHQQREEIGAVTSAFQETRSELNATTNELNLKQEENRQLTDNLNRLGTELHRVSENLSQRETELTQKQLELDQKNEQLRLVLTSQTWLLTKPVRVILDAAGMMSGKLLQPLTRVVSIIRSNGGVQPTIRKVVNVLRKEGFSSISYHYRMQTRNASGSAPPLSVHPEETARKAATPEKSQEAKRFQSPHAVLFIGHDARLAGAQVLLLSLIRWFREHTAIEIRIILLQGGVLLDKFMELGPTLVWEQVIQHHPVKEERQHQLSHFTGKISLVYGNTVLSPSIYDELEFLKAPYITHVHELEESIKLYVEKSAVEKMHTYTNGYIGCSEPVSQNLIRNHAVQRECITTIHEFIEERLLNFSHPKQVLRNKLGMVDMGIVVIGCGTFYWRKGGDLFIETALLVKQKGITDFHFYWIGENIWDIDQVSYNLSPWSRLEQRIKENGLENHITFLGVKENVFDYLQAGDLFYLPSREDPFPLVCLEAAQCGLPVICFENAGGMPAFVESDAGFVVPFEDADAAAEKIVFLLEHPLALKELGYTARKKFLQRHSISIGAPEILCYCRKIGNFQPTVTVVVPNYNCEKFLARRLESIFAQTFQDVEVILLDDASTDQSLEVIDRYLHLPNVRLIKNPINSGSPFIQWQKGIEEAKGAIIWFAEADDACEPGFLHTLLPYFHHASVALAYCDSSIMDDRDVVTGDYVDYYNTLDPEHWKSSYLTTATREINFGLGVKNSIPNASAVLVRKSCIPVDFGKEMAPFRFSGDWFFYTMVLKGRMIAYHPGKLNFHRKHNQTVTSAFNTEKGDQLLKEAALIHQHILQNYPLDAEFLPKWEYYLSEQIRAFHPRATKSDFDVYYPYSDTEKRIKEAIEKGKQRKKLVFVTTNDGSANGGSEQLWRQVAIECSRRGDEVMVVIKNWQPEPFFLKDFYSNGITVVLKETEHFTHVQRFGPDLVVISLGDQDEGVEYFEQCRINGIRYVIVNQLTKEPKYWPIDHRVVGKVKQGYLGAEMALFTGRNNKEVMEKRLGCELPNAGLFSNPYDVDRNTHVPFPSMERGLNIAVVGNLLRIHKGQHLALELFQQPKWRNRGIHLNIYGEGADKEILRTMVADNAMKNVIFHGHTFDILSVWRENHAILMPSFMEGLPLALVGAMICGRVPIVTDIGAHREVIKDNFSGFISAEPTVEALDEACERAYQKKEEWETIGQKARRTILENFPEDPVATFIEQLAPFVKKQGEEKS